MGALARSSEVGGAESTAPPTIRVGPTLPSGQSPLGIAQLINTFVVELDFKGRTSLRAAAMPNRCIWRPTYVGLDRTERLTVVAGFDWVSFGFAPVQRYWLDHNRVGAGVLTKRILLS